MSKYYFLETVLVKGNLKVKALPGQKLKDGSNVSTSLYVQCPKKIRDVYSEGTIFISTSLNLSSSGGKFYTQKGFQRLTYKDEEAKKEYKTLTGIDFVDPLKKATILETRHAVDQIVKLRNLSYEDFENTAMLQAWINVEFEETLMDYITEGELEEVISESVKKR